MLLGSKKEGEGEGRRASDIRRRLRERRDQPDRGSRRSQVGNGAMGKRFPAVPGRTEITPAARRDAEPYWLRTTCGGSYSSRMIGVRRWFPPPSSWRLDDLPFGIGNPWSIKSRDRRTRSSALLCGLLNQPAPP